MTDSRKVPWEIIEHVENIRCKLHAIQGKINHTFREENIVVDALSNEVMDTQDIKENHSLINYKKA